MFDLTRLQNPTIDRRPTQAVRDPALLVHNEQLWCYYTVAYPSENRYQLTIDGSRSANLQTWTSNPVTPTTEHNYSSPGNLIHINDEWLMCIQSYPVDPGGQYGNEDSRLWLIRSRNLLNWSAPELINPAGCQGTWTSSTRQIDPYLVQHDDAFWCFYKTSGQLGLIVSEDLQTWREADPSRPVLAAQDTPDGVTVENPCIIPLDGGFAMFFAPCRPGRGVGLAYSTDLLHWQDIHYLTLPTLPWANNGPTAAMVLDLRETLGVWLMAFHGEQAGEANTHSAAIAFAWSENLEDWHLP